MWQPRVRRIGGGWVRGSEAGLPGAASRSNPVISERTRQRRVSRFETVGGLSQEYRQGAPKAVCPEALDPPAPPPRSRFWLVLELLAHATLAQREPHEINQHF